MDISSLLGGFGGGGGGGKTASVTTTQWFGRDQNSSDQNAMLGWIALGAAGLILFAVILLIAKR